MRIALLRRLKRLETVRTIESAPEVELQIGYVKELAEEYVGEGHIVTVGRDSEGHYQWEERPGPEPASETEANASSIVRVILEPPKHEQSTRNTA